MTEGEMKKLVLAALILPLLLAACGGSSGGSTVGSTNGGAAWDRSTWDSDATWAP
jgi:hypothetical protein